MSKSSINSKIKVSVIIVNYNTGKLILQCINSVRRTTSNSNNPPLEIIVIDNASPDGSIKGIKKIKDIKVTQNKENIGFAKAVNQGIKVARGEYILLLNPDTRVQKGAIKDLLAFAQTHNNVGAVSPKLLDPDGKVQASVMHFPTLWRAIQEFWFGREVYSKYSPQGQDVQEVEAIVMAAFLITPEALEKVGLLDERYFIYFEDLEYCRKVQSAGLKVYYLPQAKVLHYHGASGKDLAEPRDQWRRLIPSSKIYHGILKHYLINLVIWLGQKIRR